MAIFGAYEDYHLSRDTFGVLGTCRWPGGPFKGSEALESKDTEFVWADTKCFGKPADSGEPLELSLFRYSWRLLPRTSVTFEEVQSQNVLRPDLQLVCRMQYASSVVETSSALKRRFSDGDAYQIPDEIASDQTIAFLVRKALYFDRMAIYLFEDIDTLEEIL